MSDSIIYTNSHAMAADISDLIGIPVEVVLSDYADELELDVSHAAFNSLLREDGIEILPTETRILIERCKNKQPTDHVF